jgi:hypothetical protein
MRSWSAIDDDVARLHDIEMGELGLSHAGAHSSDTRLQERPRHDDDVAQDRHHAVDSHEGSLPVGAAPEASSEISPASPGHAFLGTGSAAASGSGGGNGGNGAFFGSMLDLDIAIYAPINIAIAIGNGASATAIQSNFAWFDQGAHQMAGIGGHGGNGNAFWAGEADLYAALFHSGSGSAGAGNGGDGTFIGVMSDNDLAIFTPVNVAVAGPGSTAVAHQINGAFFHQGATQTGGVGGHGGDGNLALSADLIALPSDFADHLFLHA